MTYLPKRLNPIRYLTAALFLILLSSCGSQNNETETTLPTTTTSTTTPVKFIGEPVTDFNAIFEDRKAIDHSYVSVDIDGLYGVIVTNQFDFMQYMSNGWMSITPSIQNIKTDGTSQSIDGITVEKAIDVTTRDFTGDRESDFLIRFGSSFAKSGAILNSQKGVIELKPFCLSNPSKERPGVIRVFTLENLAYSDLLKTIEGDDVAADGSHLKEYWKWNKKSGCFKTTSSF